MWRASRLSATAAQNMQVDAGTLLNTFDINNPSYPADSAIVCATTGDFSITCEPETEDFFEDVNNAPNNTKEGKRITGWNCELTINCLEINENTLLLALGAADTKSDGGVHPRIQYELTDFKSLYWIGDMVDNSKVLVVAMDNTVSTGGVSLTTTNNGKGQLALTLMPHATIANTDKVPMAFYLLEKVDTTVTYSVTFNTNGGSSIAAQTVSSGAKVTEPTDPTKTGNIFSGWYKDEDLTENWNFAHDTVSENTTLYAKWTEE